ncbi:nicotinate-nucleotide adenylyltransferase [sulfur-oxidizing endosymbiont of Gigantopelta aegis]|uniref:nicotinate-nucleotide adenylyltransferase n=1 Tax=sulfur-oxidizing endosymbiont of Gigantopelta aegis TaxID=2794934 RepID=UPI001FECF90D|nr:nicotinate-nucleotide adenylyltransferase [sulfur-oxidizing endosymbiont of Gigantopelta aegis]
MVISGNNRPIVKQRPIGIYGGSFDPIHYGHLRPNLELCERLDLAQVRFIPAFQSPHKDSPQIPLEQRLEMVAQAIKDEPRFVLDEREIQRGGASYTIDTLKSLRQDYPERPLCLLMGMDAFAGIDQWHQWQAILDYAHIIVSHRPSMCADRHDKLIFSATVERFYQAHKADENNINDSIGQCLSGTIHLEPVTQLAISATDIRNRLKNKQSIRYLMPEAVINLIKYYDLYT